VKYPWFGRELHNVDNNKTKAHKYLKEFETLHVRPMSELDQCFYDTAFPRFRELRRDFKSLHRLKYAQYIARIGGGSKNNLRGFFKYADMKRNASGYPSSMFLGSDCARDSQSIANLFAGFYEAYTCGMIGSQIVTCQFLATVIKCLQLRSLRTRSSALFWASTLTKNSARTELHQVVKVPLTFVFNLSLSAGVFPAIWKESFVVPLFKSGDSRDVSCYRGMRKWYAIGLLPSFVLSYPTRNMVL
jgi:hypothetical protein